MSKEYLIWINCSHDARSKAFNDSLLEGWENSVLIVKIDEYEKKSCSSKPKKWKFEKSSKTFSNPFAPNDL